MPSCGVGLDGGSRVIVRHFIAALLLGDFMIPSIQKYAPTVFSFSFKLTTRTHSYIITSPLFGLIQHHR
jgi:hypothetical protein